MHKKHKNLSPYLTLIDNDKLIIKDNAVVGLSGTIINFQFDVIWFQPTQR